MSAAEQDRARHRAASWRRAGIIVACIAPFLLAIPSLVAMWKDGVLFDLIEPARWLVLFAPTVLVLLVVVAVMLLRRRPGYEQRRGRTLARLALSTLLLTIAVVGVGRVVWSSSITSAQASSGIGVGTTYVGAPGSDALGEVVFVPYKLDGLPAYQARVAAVSLSDGALIWDRKLDSDPSAGFPVAVASVEPQGAHSGEPLDPSTQTSTVIVSTESGAVGLYPDDGAESCGAAPRDENDCGAEPGAGALASTGERLGAGKDLYGRRPDGIELTDGDTVLDPVTGAPAGDCFRIEYRTGAGARIIVDDRAIAETEGVSSLQQVLVAPSGAVALLMGGENGKSVLVIASKDGLRQVTIGDRGLVAWPAWMG